MNFFPFRGGLHPEGHKELTNGADIVKMPVPKRLHVPLTQHIGLGAEACVKIGQQVLKGELLAKAQGAISAAVHAPTSGTIVAVEPHPAPHPSGLPVITVVMESDGEDRWIDAHVPHDPFELQPEEIAEVVAHAGIVGMGGATFPTAVKLGASASHHIHTLIVNGGECEPYLTCDDRLMRERAAKIVDGVRIVLHTLRHGNALVAIEENKPEAIAAMRAAAHGFGNIEVIPVPALYPMGWDKQLIQLLLGKEVPADGRSAQLGVLVHNVATLAAISDAVRHGRPLVSRVVTVAGAVKQPKNVEVPVGTLMQDVIDFCGGFTEPPARLVHGGPMMGDVMPHLNVPVVKGTSGILALAQNDLPEHQARACIRCGQCVQACPCGLLPLEMAARIRKDDFKGAENYGVTDCISCGSCAYVCPSHIPLVQYFNHAKGHLALEHARAKKAKELGALTEAKRERTEREAAARKARAAAAAQAAREKAAAKAAATENPQ
jgi:electron transport complex protein RnfC